MSIPNYDDIIILIQDVDGTPMLGAKMLASILGLRRSEISVLTPQDIDEPNRTISINKAMVLDADGHWVIKPPKSYEGYRVLTAPDIVFSTLNRYPHNEFHVVPITPNHITYEFAKLKKQRGFNFRFHDLRHYNASITLALGVPDKYAMERMGHATPDMLKRVYQHTIQSKRIEVSDVVNSYFDSLIQPDI